MTSISRQNENPTSAGQLPVEPKPEPGIFAKLGLNFQAPAQAEYGADAYPSLLRRITSAIMLIIVVVLTGIAIAGAIGAIILVAGFILEQAIS